MVEVYAFIKMDIIMKVDGWMINIMAMVGWYMPKETTMKVIGGMDQQMER